MVPISKHAIDAILDMICRVAIQQPVHFLWRPRLRDPQDEMVLEAAVNSRARFLVTHNIKDFDSCRFNELRIVTPQQFIRFLEGKPS